MPPVDGSWADSQAPSLFSNTAGTNGLAAMTLVQHLPTLSIEELELLPYLTGVIARLGTGERTYQQQAAVLQQTCEQCGCSYRLFRRPGSSDINATLSLHISGLESKTGHMAEELQRLLTQQRFDEHERHHDMLAQRLDRLGRSVIDRGHRLAARPQLQQLIRWRLGTTTLVALPFLVNYVNVLPKKIRKNLAFNLNSCGNESPPDPGNYH